MCAPEPVVCDWLGVPCCPSMVVPLIVFRNGALATSHATSRFSTRNKHACGPRSRWGHVTQPNTEIPESQMSRAPFRGHSRITTNHASVTVTCAQTNLRVHYGLPPGAGYSPHPCMPSGPKAQGDTPPLVRQGPRQAALSHHYAASLVPGLQMAYMGVGFSQPPGGGRSGLLG